jgi:hypothetical protein
MYSIYAYSQPIIGAASSIQSPRKRSANSQNDVDALAEKRERTIGGIGPISRSFIRYRDPRSCLLVLDGIKSQIPAKYRNAPPRG